MPFRFNNTYDNDAFRQTVDLVRSAGHDNRAAIVIYPLADGSWEVDDGDALRFAAVKQVSGEFITNLLGNKIGRVRFSLHGSSRDGAYQAPRISLGDGG